MTGPKPEVDSRYHQYWEEMPCYLSVHDRDFRIIDGNRRFREDFAERMGQYCYKVYKGREEICPDCPVEATFADGRNHPSEQLLITTEGVEVPVVVHTTAIFDDAGEVVAVMEMHTDIGEVKRLQFELQRSQERLAQLFRGGALLHHRPGPRPRDPARQPQVPRDLRRPCRRELLQDVQAPRGAVSGVPHAADLRHRRDPRARGGPLHADGEKLNGLCTTAPLRNSDGEVEAVIEMCFDITQIRELQSQLASIGLLVGSISHGIKGLLTGLDGGIYMVNTGFAKDKPERVEKGWEMVQRNVERIRSMVLDILYYAKDRELAVEDVDLAALVSEFREGLEKKASDADTTFEVDIAPDTGVFPGDPQAIRAMLLNLLENSLDACRMDKDKDSHAIRLGIRRDPQVMVIEVEDNGMGMDQETREKLFSLFFSSKGIKGTGLGLFISNKIVDKHGGSIGVDSEPGRGAKFEIRLPLVASPSIKSEEIVQ